MKVLGCFYSYSGPVHVKLVKLILWYVFKTLELDLKVDKKADIPNNIVGYIDSDIADSKSDRKSNGGYVFMLAKVAISHLSNLQLIIVLSTYEAEYVAMYKTIKEAVWLG